MTGTQPIRAGAGLAYGLLGLPLAFVALPLYVLLPNHYAREFGMPLATLGSVLLAARLLDAVSDPLLGWTTVDGRQFYVRQLRNMKGRIPLDELDAKMLTGYASVVGQLLAKGHARTSGASMIAGWPASRFSPSPQPLSSTSFAL